MKYMFGFMLEKGSYSPPVSENFVTAETPDEAADIARKWYAKNPSPFGGDASLIVLTNENLRTYTFPYEV